MQLRLTENPRKKNRFYWMQMVSAMLACISLVFTVGTITSLTGSSMMVAMLTGSVILCAIYGLFLRKKCPDRFFLGVQILVLVLILISRSRVLEGFRLMWNTMADARLLGTGLMLIPLELQLDQGQQELCGVLFGVVVSCVLSMGACFLAIRAPYVLAAVLPVLTLTGMLFFGIALDMLHMIGILAVAMLILMCSGWGASNALSTVARSWLGGAVFAAMLLIVVMIPQVRNRMEQLGTNNQRIFHEYKYETEHTTLPEGDFTNFQSPDKGAEAALIVTMEQPQVMYLRGFTGSVFEDDQWKPLEKELLVKNKALLYSLNRTAFNPNAQFQAASRQSDMQKGKITIQNLGACSRYRYVPFSLCEDDALCPEDLNTEGVLSDGNRVYTYSAVTTGKEEVALLLQFLQESEDGEVMQYRKAESAYRHFVKSFYLQVPDPVKSMLAPRWDAVAANYGMESALTLQQAQSCALQVLGQFFSEEGIPEDLELPLDCARGTSYQYATVAALTFRYYGIPARYAEGYVITEKMVSNLQPGQALAVDGSCARGWVEVYQDGIGWIPMELLPGIGEMIQEDPEDSGDNTDGETENEDLEPEEAEEESPMEEDTQVPDPTGGSVVQVAMMAFTVLLKILSVLLLVFLFVFFRRRYILRRREKKFHGEDPHDAVGWIFADTVKILNKLGFDSGNGSLRRLCEPVEKQFGREYGEKLMQMVCLNDRSLFSSRKLEEEQRQCALQFRLETIDKANIHLKWYRKLWLKWMRCLY